MDERSCLIQCIGEHSGIVMIENNISIKSDTSLFKQLKILLLWFLWISARGKNGCWIVIIFYHFNISIIFSR